MHKNDGRFGGLCRCYGPLNKTPTAAQTATKIFI
jgi:hypothetical protein